MEPGSRGWGRVLHRGWDPEAVPGRHFIHGAKPGDLETLKDRTMTHLCIRPLYPVKSVVLDADASVLQHEQRACLGGHAALMKAVSSTLGLGQYLPAAPLSPQRRASAFPGLLTTSPCLSSKRVRGRHAAAGYIVDKAQVAAEKQIQPL